MASLTLENLRGQLKRREIAPVYVLYGAETYLRDIAAKTIAEFSFVEGDFRDFNETDFSLNSEDNLKRALATAEELPMMASRRVILITDVRISATGFRDTIKEEHEPVLSAYLANPSPHSVVIFIADEFNGVRKMSKLLIGGAVAVDFKPLADAELANWARKEIEGVGANIDDRTLRHLIGMVGPDVRRLTNEINKLATAALPDTQIKRELVESLVPNSRELSNFDLTDHLVAGRKPQALLALKKILDDGAEPLALLGLISYNYRRLLMAKEMMSKSADRSEIGRVVKFGYGNPEPFLAAARRASSDKLVSALQSFAKTDLAIKTSIGGGGPIGARMQIEILVCELAVM